VPTELPHWLGIDTLRPLTLGTVRYLGPQTEPLAPARTGRGRTADARARHGLLVYDGGQA